VLGSALLYPTYGNFFYGNFFRSTLIAVVIPPNDGHAQHYVSGIQPIGDRFTPLQTDIMIGQYFDRLLPTAGIFDLAFGGGLGRIGFVELR
jgi:hypothetical protein